MFLGSASWTNMFAVSDASSLSRDRGRSRSSASPDCSRKVLQDFDQGLPSTRGVSPAVKAFVHLPRWRSGLRRLFIDAVVLLALFRTTHSRSAVVGPSSSSSPCVKPSSSTLRSLLVYAGSSCGNHSSRRDWESKHLDGRRGSEQVYCRSDRDSSVV